jgi:hypothetical protein
LTPFSLRLSHVVNIFNNPSIELDIMASAQDLQALLRFLSQDAKVPLVQAMSKVKDLQGAKLNT